MTETQPPTIGEQVLLELGRAGEDLRDTDNELLHAIGTVLKAFANSYEAGSDNCSGHARQTYHLRCMMLVQNCACIAPYLALARWATA